MKLFAWIPAGSIGQYAIAVLAEDELAARAAAEAEVTRIRREEPSQADHMLRGWGTDHYELRIREAGQPLAIEV